ncbi:MAG: phosphoribosyltransferase family protein [Acidimicrobiia bacterium]
MSYSTLLDRVQLARTVERLGAEITRDHPDGVVLVGVLKGALVLTADLARAITDVPVEIDFIAISRYAPDSGRVRILKDLDLDVAGRDVVVVEDMVDTGLSLAYLLGQLESRHPRRVDVCTMLDRAVRRIVPLEVRYRGIELGDVFVLGYGLHRDDLYRNLPYIVEADRELIGDDPAALVPLLYGAVAVPGTRSGSGSVAFESGSVTDGGTQDS